MLVTVTIVHVLRVADQSSFKVLLAGEKWLITRLSSLSKNLSSSDNVLDRSWSCNDQAVEKHIVAKEYFLFQLYNVRDKIMQK
jgi:hypothetical protein